MGRKRREPIELIEESLDELAAESRASEAEAPVVENLEEELELLDADDEEKDEVTVSAAMTNDEEDTVVSEVPKAPAKKRASRRKKAVVEAVAEPVVAQASEEVAVSIEEQAPPVETPAREEISAPASPAFDPNQDAVRQWELIKQISETVCVSLERTSAQIKEMPSQVAAAFQENFRAPVARPAPITKIAVLAAGFALVLSALSLSLAQSARQSSLAKEVSASVPRERREELPRQAELPPVKLVPTAAAPVARRTPQPSSIAAEIARVDAPRPRPPAPRVASVPPVKKHAVVKNHR